MDKIKGKSNKAITDNNILYFGFSNTIPDMVEVKSKNSKWTLYGIDNNYPQFLLDLYNRSNKHKAITNKKVHYIKGNGFYINTDGLTTLQIAKIEQFIENINKSEHLDLLLEKVSLDLEIFNGFAIQSVPNNAKTATAKINHVDFLKLRINEEDEKIWFSDNWPKSGKPKDEELKEVRFFNPRTFEGIYYFKKYTPGSKTYPIPEYSAAVRYMETDYEISNFHYNNTKNGFSAGTIISLNNGEPDDPEEKKKIEQKIKRKYTGTDNAGGIFIVFSNGKDSAPTVIPVTPNNFDKLFDILNNTVQQEIFTAHNVTSPMLFGIRVEGQLGGRSELREASELFQNIYVSGKQKTIEDAFNFIFEANGLGRPLKIQPTQPLSFELTEQSLVQILTKNELREKIGMPPLEDETAASPTKFSSEQDIEKAFQEFGVSKTDYQILKSKEVENGKEALISEVSFYRQGFADDKESGSSNASKEPINPTIERVEIMYSYEVRSGFGDPIISTTRPLCKKLIELDRLYSRADIDKISQRVGFDVWRMRGGYYHDPKKDITTPFCRHIWKQNVVRKNG